MSDKDLLIQLQSDYMDFLGEELSKKESFLLARGNYSPDPKSVSKGKELRDQISQIKKRLEQKESPKGEFEIPFRDTNTYAENPNGDIDIPFFVLLLIIVAIFFLGLFILEIKR